MYSAQISKFPTKRKDAYRTMIKKSFNITTIVCGKFAEGSLEAVGEIRIDKKVNKYEAYRMATKKYGNEAIVIKVTYDKEIYEISKEEFVKHATKVEG